MIVNCDLGLSELESPWSASTLIECECGTMLTIIGCCTITHIFANDTIFVLLCYLSAVFIVAIQLGKELGPCISIFVFLVIKSGFITLNSSTHPSYV